MVALAVEKLYAAEAKPKSTANLKRGTEKPEVADLPPRESGDPVKARERAAAALSVSPRLVQDAKKVDRGSPGCPRTRPPAEGGRWVTRCARRPQRATWRGSTCPRIQVAGAPATPAVMTSVARRERFDGADPGPFAPLTTRNCSLPDFWQCFSCGFSTAPCAGKSGESPHVRAPRPVGTSPERSASKPSESSPSQPSREAEGVPRPLSQAAAEAVAGSLHRATSIPRSTWYADTRSPPGAVPVSARPTDDWETRRPTRAESMSATACCVRCFAVMMRASSTAARVSCVLRIGRSF